MDDILYTAAQAVRGKWFQGGLSDETGENFCGIGHLRCITGENYNDWHDRQNMMNNVAIEQYPDRVFADEVGLVPFAAFNDHPDTTEDEVIAVMEKAAVRYEEQV